MVYNHGSNSEDGHGPKDTPSVTRCYFMGRLDMSKSSALGRCSSMVEQRFCKAKVAGSSPAIGSGGTSRVSG